MHASNGEPATELPAGSITKACATPGCRESFSVVVTELLQSFPGLIPEHCPRCEQAREKKWRAEQDKERFARLNAEWQQLCPPEMRETDEARLPAAQLRRVLEWRPGPKGLLLFGETGMGKTRILWRLLERLHFEGLPVECVRAPELSRLIEEADTYSRGLERLVNRFANAPILALDDLGKERRTGRVETTLFDIIDLRTINRRPVIATTNFIGAALAERYSDKELGAALVRRLRDFCLPVSFGVQPAKEAPKK